MSFAAGTKIGRCKILSKLGQGGMGEVYLAEDTVFRISEQLQKLKPAC